MRHARVNVFLHCVWATWDRLPLLTEAIHRAVHRAIAAKCRELGTELIAFGGVEDHVHILVRFPATITIADLVGQIKGASSHPVTHELLPPDTFFKWQGAYGAFSVSRAHLTPVCDYIKHQREHHTTGTTIAIYEPDALAPDVPSSDAPNTSSLRPAKSPLQPATAGFVATGFQARLQAPALAQARLQAPAPAHTPRSLAMGHHSDVQCGHHKKGAFAWRWRLACAARPPSPWAKSRPRPASARAACACWQRP